MEKHIGLHLNFKYTVLTQQKEKKEEKKEENNEEHLRYIAKESKMDRCQHLETTRKSRNKRLVTVIEAF